MGEPAAVYPEGQEPVALPLTHVVVRRILMKREKRARDAVEFRADAVEFRADGHQQFAVNGPHPLT